MNTRELKIRLFLRQCEGLSLSRLWYSGPRLLRWDEQQLMMINSTGVGVGVGGTSVNADQTNEFISHAVATDEYSNRSYCLAAMRHWGVPENRSATIVRPHPPVTR